jgi:hypothetical protein
MSPKTDIYSANWHSTITAAQMCRVSPPAADVDTISIPSNVFDDLVRIAETAARLQHAPRLPAEMVIHRHNDTFAVTVFDPITEPYTVVERTLFEAMSAANAELSSIVERHLR